LWLRHEVLDRGVHDLDASRIELLRDFVALSDRAGIALARRQPVPLVGFARIELDAGAPLVEHRQVELTVRETMHGGPPEPLGCRFIVEPSAGALRPENCEIVHRLGIALARCREVPDARPLRVFCDTGALLTEAAEHELSRGEPGGRRTFQP